MLKVEIDRASLTALYANTDPKHHRIATVWAVNDLADLMLREMQAKMDRVFDQPTRFTKNAFMVWRATKAKPEATVIERPSVGKKHFLKVQEVGGPRGQTALEQLLSSRLADARDFRTLIPADAAKLDGHGNWAASERNRAFSGIQAQRDARTNTSAASRKRNAKRDSYFVPKHGLYPGIYKRDRAGNIDIIAILSQAVPRYSPRLGFEDEAKALHARELPKLLTMALAKARATAR